MGASIYTKGVDYMQIATLHTLKVNSISQSHHYNHGTNNEMAKVMISPCKAGTVNHVTNNDG